MTVAEKSMIAYGNNTNTKQTNWQLMDTIHGCFSFCCTLLPILLLIMSALMSYILLVSKYSRDLKGQI